jgi:WD40 repeat protein
MEDGSISIWAPLGKKMRPFLLLDGHTEQLHQVSFSPNGRYLASTDYDRKLVIWSTKVFIVSYVFRTISSNFFLHFAFRHGTLSTPSHHQDVDFLTPFHGTRPVQSYALQKKLV